MILSDPSKIESQLTKLFAEQGIKSRASLFNLIVYVTADDRAKYIKSLLGKLTEKFPCRILFLHVKPNHKIEFKISADVKENIPCDFIEIYLSQEDERKASFLLLPLLIPDIPIFALWGDDPTLDKTILPALYPYIDRIVFDSFCIKDIRAFANRMCDRHDLKVRDVNWAAISGWRQILANTIDNPQEIEHVKHADEVIIEYNGDKTPGLPNPEIQAFYLKAWLQAKLHYDEKVKFHLIALSNHGSRAGDILSIVIKGKNNSTFNYRRKNFAAEIHIEFDNYCEMPENLPLAHVQRGFKFWREIFFEDISQDYRLMLQRLKN